MTSLSRHLPGFPSDDPSPLETPAQQNNRGWCGMFPYKQQSICPISQLMEFQARTGIITLAFYLQKFL